MQSFLPEGRAPGQYGDGHSHHDKSSQVFEETSEDLYGKTLGGSV